jgi:DNA polymerase III delta prime subunit
LAEGKELATLTLFKALILKYHIENPANQEERKVAKADAKKALTQYLNEQGAPYSIYIDKMSAACQDGLLLYALIHGLNKDALKFNEIEKQDPVKMNQNAIDYAFQLFKIPPIVTGEDITINPDEVIVMTYLSYFRETKFILHVYHSIKHSMGVSVIQKLPKLEGESQEHMARRLWRNLEDQIMSGRISVEKVHENIDEEMNFREERRLKEHNNLIEQNKSDEKRIPVLEQRLGALKKEYEKNFKEKEEELKKIEEKTKKFLEKEFQEIEDAQKKIDLIVEGQRAKIKQLERKLQENQNINENSSFVNPLVEDRNTILLSNLEILTEDDRRNLLLPAIFKSFPEFKMDERTNILLSLYSNLTDEEKSKKLLPFISEFSQSEEKFSTFDDLITKVKEDKHEAEKIQKALHEEEVLFQDADKSRFLFVGKPTYENFPTFYIGKIIFSLISSSPSFKSKFTRPT